MDSNLLMTTIVMLRKELERVDSVIASVQKLALETHQSHSAGPGDTDPDIRRRSSIKKSR
jgi:hypothetical protein